MTTRGPGVSVGLPVYNGGPMLAEALESILAQTYTDLEIVIADNGSADGTEALCRAFAERDARIRYERNELNVGAPDNFNRVFRMSTRQLFKWAAHDDLLAPTFVERCVESLDATPDAVLAFSRIVAIDEAGTVQKALPPQLPDTSGDDPVRRFEAVAAVRHGGFYLWGVMRADVLEQTELHPRYPGGDKVLLAEMTLRGRFIEVPEPLFKLRVHSGRSVAAMPSIYLRAGWHDPGRRARFLFPHWRLADGFLRAVRRAPLRGRRRRVAFRSMVGWVFRNWNWSRLAMDLVVMVLPSSWKVFESARAWMRRRQIRSTNPQ